MQDGLKKIEERLEKLQSDFNNQIQAIDNDVSGFHKQMLDLSSRHSDSKELIEFIVFINDRIDLKQMQFEDVIKDTLKTMIEYKKDLIDINSRIINKVQEIDERKPPSLWRQALSKIKSIADIKIILGIIAVIGLMILKLFFPDVSDEVMKYLVSVFL